MLTELETRLLGVMMMLIMLGMGASLTFKDFRIAFRKPAGIGIGIVTDPLDIARATNSNCAQLLIVEGFSII